MANDLRKIAAKLDMEIVSLGELTSRLSDLGYELDRDFDCRGTSRVMTGPHAGLCYPCVTTGLREADTKVRVYNDLARRDDRYRKLKELRGTVAVISRGALLEI